MNMDITSKKDKLFIDIGLYSISYSVLSTNHEVKYFKIESFVTDLADLFEDRTIKFIERVVNTAREVKLNFPEVEDIVILIPTKDILLKSNNKVTKKLLEKVLQDEYKIDSGIDLVQSISRPYKIGDKYFTPVSFYDQNIDKLILELSETDNAIKDRLRGNVIFQTSLYRMIKMANNTYGKVAIVDSSFTKTRVLLAKDGNPVEYNEFDLSGSTMLKYVYSKSPKGIEEIIKLLNSYEDVLEKEIDEAVKAQEYLFKEADKEIIPHLRKANLDRIIFMGGLSNTDYLDKLNVPIERLNNYYNTTSNEIIIPETVEYKIQQGLNIPVHGGLLDDSNMEIIMGTRDINDFTTSSKEEEDKVLTTEEIIGESNDFNNDYYVSLSNKIKDSLPKNNDTQLLSNKDSGMTVINLENNNVKPNKKIVVKSITQDQLQMLDQLKKKFKKPRRIEKVTGVWVTGIFLFLSMLVLLVTFNYAGMINDAIFSKFGIEQPYVTTFRNDYYTALNDKILKTIKITKVNGNRIGIANNSATNTNIISTVKVPKETDFKYNFGYYLVKNLQSILNSELSIDINVDDTSDNLNNLYIIRLRFPEPNVNGTIKDGFDGGKITTTGSTKWTEEEDRLFFDSEDYNDFIEGKRQVGEPSRNVKKKLEKTEKLEAINNSGTQQDTSQNINQ